MHSQHTLSDAILAALHQLGARYAFGVVGGALLPFFAAVERSELELVHCRHESGAVYAAVEASLASDAPALAFTTTGPGLTNALTGILTARWEGAKLLLISGYTAANQRGRFALQESHEQTLSSAFYAHGAVFDYAAALEDISELPRVLRSLARGFASRRGFVAHLAIPLAVQAQSAPPQTISITGLEVTPSLALIQEVAERLREPFAIWVGFGARHAADLVRALVAHTNAPVLATPRGKGIFPEDDPRYLGVSGVFGSDFDLLARVRATGVRRMLVLGTRLGEVSSAFQEALLPAGGLIHIDLDANVPGSAFPQVETLAVQAEIGQFLGALLAQLAVPELPAPVAPRPRPPRLSPRTESRIRPQYLMQCLQSRVVEGSRCVVLAEAGSAFAWTARHLRFSSPYRYRQPGLFCATGHTSTGALGTALATRRRAVAIVGDGAFLLQNELSTAARLNIEVTWIVLNDARHGMAEQGLRRLNYPTVNVSFPEVDFPGYVRALGAQCFRVDQEHDLCDAIDRALGSRGPFVLDVLIDPTEAAPLGSHLQSLDRQIRGGSI